MSACVSFLLLLQRLSWFACIDGHHQGWELDLQHPTTQPDYLYGGPSRALSAAACALGLTVKRMGFCHLVGEASSLLDGLWVNDPWVNNPHC